MNNSVTSTLISEQTLKSIVHEVIQQGMKMGATAVEVSASSGKGFSVAARNRQIDELEQQQDTGLGITIFRGHQQGIATTGDLRPAALQQCLKAANDIARFTQPDPCLGLPEPEELAQSWPELSLYHPWEVDSGQATEIALACEEMALAMPGITYSDGVFINSYESISVFGNSLGFLEAFKSTRHSLSCSLIAEKDGHKERDYDYTAARDSKDLLDFKKIIQSTAEKTVSRLGSRKIATSQVPVLFRPEVATGLIRSLLRAISGGNLYQRSSFLCDSLGKKVFPDFVSIEEDPFVLKGLASCPYDGEAVQVKKRSLVENGHIAGYLLSCYSARRLNMKTTGNSGGAHNIFVSHSDASLKELIAQMHTGLIVTDVMGQGVNIVTGDYSRGCAGFWVENGEVQFPVSEMTIAGNLKDMFAGIVAIGNDIERRGSTHVGSILVDKMTVGGNN